MSLLAARFIAIAAYSCAIALGSTATGAAVASGDADKLMAMLPQGFSSSNCQDVGTTGQTIEKVSCEQSSDSGGPSQAVFALYGSLNDLAAGFQHASDAMTVASSCPGGIKSPSTWSSGGHGGQVECGIHTQDKTPIVVWTDKAKLRGAAIKGSDITTLYEWWTNRSD